MTKDFYLQQVERLRRVYSPTALNEDRVVLLWEKFKQVDGTRFELAVNHLIGEFTTQSLPSLSRFSEAVMMFQNKSSTSHMDHVPAGHFCEPCRDFGFDWEGDTIVACKRCVNGKEISPAKLAKEQKNYDRGRALFKNPRQLLKGFGTRLPYDPSERGEIQERPVSENLKARDELLAEIDRSNEWA